MALQNYALVRISDNIVENAIIWDGVVTYSPNGYTVVLFVGAAWIGWTWTLLDGFLPP